MHILERLPRETGREYALRNIQYNIIHLHLAPGSLISENELAAEMGLSRTPVREALIELAKVKIIEIYPQKRSVVALIDYRLVEESRFLRNLLECAVVRLVCDMATPEHLCQLEENLSLQQLYCEKQNYNALLDMDNLFHRKLFEISEKMQSYELMQTIAIHFDRVRSIALDTVRDYKILEDHSAILQSIRDHDPDAAASRMQLHLSRYKIDAKVIQENYPQYF